MFRKQKRGHTEEPRSQPPKTEHLEEPLSESPSFPPAQETHKTTRVSRERVDEIVEGFMQNHSINNVFLPDFIERAIYTNVIRLILGVAEEILDGTSIEILGHRVELKITGS